MQNTSGSCGSVTSQSAWRTNTYAQFFSRETVTALAVCQRIAKADADKRIALKRKAENDPSDSEVWDSAVNSIAELWLGEDDPSTVKLICSSFSSVIATLQAFLGRLTCLEPTAKKGELCFAGEGTGARTRSETNLDVNFEESGPVRADEVEPVRVDELGPTDADA